MSALGPVLNGHRLGAGHADKSHPLKYDYAGCRNEGSQTNEFQKFLCHSCNGSRKCRCANRRTRAIELQSEAQISGALFVGLQRSEGRPQMRNTTLHVEVPEDWVGDVSCLRVRSANGLYDSVAEYAIDDDDDGEGDGGTLVTLQFPTAHAAFLAERPAGGVAALITRGSCTEQPKEGDEQPTESAVVRWDATDDTPVTLFLNAFRADRVYVYLGDATDPVECTPLTDEGRTAYDVRCNIGAVAAAGAVDLEVFSVTNGQPSDTARLRLRPMGTR